MAKLVWGETGKKFFETGISKGVFYKRASDGKYPLGVPWNGLTGVTESPSGAESTPVYADNTKYVTLVSAETFGGTVEAYSYPPEFGECNGLAEIAKGVTIGQQARGTFGMSYVTNVGNDVDLGDHGYKIHLIYGAVAAPSEVNYATINDSPEAAAMSWDIDTTPVNVTGYKPTATLVIDSRTVDATKLALLEDKLYGTATEPATLLLPDEVIAIVGAIAQG